MSLSIVSHRADEITVLTCTGRIVEGAESAALLKHVNDLIVESPYILLHLGGIEFIDSSGLGLLVRCLVRTEGLHGIMRICAASPRLLDALKVTGLNTVFKVFDTEADAVAGFFDNAGGKRATTAGASILCLEQSPDVLAYIGQLLRQAGYVVMTTTNLPDGLTLLTATRPKLLVIGATIQALRKTGIANRFNAVADTLQVVELPPAFSGQDAAAAGQELLARVRPIMEMGLA